MIHFARWLISGCILFCLADNPAFAGAWPQPPGSTLAIVSATHSLAHRQYDVTGNAISRGRFRKIEAQLYVEHGLTDYLTLIGQVARSTDQTEAFDRQFTQGAFRRVELGARAHLFTWEETLYSVDAIVAMHTAFEGDDPAASHSGDLDYEFGLTTGSPTTILGFEAFSESRVAYRHRPGIRPSEARADITLGIYLEEDWLVMIKSNTQNSLGKTPSPLGHFWSSKGELSIVHRLQPGFNIETATFRTFLGRNTLKETGLKIAFWYQF